MSVLLPSQNPSFPDQNRFSWPIFILVLLVHAAFLGCLFLKSTPTSSPITPPMVGVLISPGTFSNTTSSASLPKQGLFTHKKIATNSNKVTGLAHQNKNQASPAKTSTQTAHDKTTSSFEGTLSDASSGQLKGENDDLSGMHRFFSPSVDTSYAHNPKPPYPLVSRRMGEEGTVILSVYILKTGAVDKILLKKSSGYPRLDKAAMTGIKNWRYTPARKGNTAISVWHTQAIRFSLKD